MPQQAQPLSYTSLVHLFTSHLTICIHSILAVRSIYPTNTFLTAKAYNVSIRQSRHPGVCAWINDAVAAVEAELMKGTVARVVLVIFEGDNYEGKTSNRPLERYVWDVRKFPEVPKGEIGTPFVRQGQEGLGSGATERDAAGDADNESDKVRRRMLEKAHVDLEEQFRGLLSRLSTIGARLRPIPPNCTYTLCVELKDEADPPIGHPQPWIPTEAGSQNKVTHEQILNPDGDQQGESEIHRRMDKGKELGGSQTVPIRTVDAGEMMFEMWVEEGEAKFDPDSKQSSFGSATS